MTTQFARSQPEGGTVAPNRERAGGAAEALFAAVTIVLAILGLAGVASAYLDTIAVIALGVAFLCERWTVARGVDQGTLPGLRREHGLVAESVAGWAGIVLGILSLLRLVPTVLVPIAVIVFGAGMALGAGVGSRSGRVLVGCAAVVLGILALIGIDPRTLALVGLLGVGAALLLSGPVVAWRGHHHAVRQPAV